jgi:hypothetical protein
MSRSLGIRLAACGALAALLLAPTTIVSAGTLALTGGTVHTITAGDLENATVLVKDGKIVAVGTSVEVPSDATVVDCAPCASSRHARRQRRSGSPRSSVSGLRTRRPAHERTSAVIEFSPGNDLLPVARVSGSSALRFRGRLRSGHVGAHT